MDIEMTTLQAERHASIKRFVDNEIVPFADDFDNDEQIPTEIIKKIASAGYLGSFIPKKYGGGEWDMISIGCLCEEIGRASASLLSLLTVHGMISSVISKWGTATQKEKWLPILARGEVICAFALSEPGIGSDAEQVETEAVLTDSTYLLNGRKKWISFGQIANLFLIIGHCKGRPLALLMEKETPGLSVAPISGMLGFRAAMLAELTLENVGIPEENLVGHLGFGFSHIVATALDFGRYAIAWGSVGLSQACINASLRYTADRKQFGVYLKDHQLIQQMLADMITDTKAARLLCWNAGRLKDTGNPTSIMETSIAKYFASRSAVRSAMNAVQIHGANGCSREYPVQRYMRDAKILEIIEGSNQIQQVLIAKSSFK